jgi:hypothetical protein
MLDSQDYYDIPRIIILLLGGVPLFIAFGIIPLIYIKIVKPLDKLFYGKGLTFEEGVWFASTLIRMAQYTLCIVIPERSKKDRYAKLIYKGYDFRGNATREQVFLSYLYIVCFVLFLASSFLLILYDYIVRPLLIEHGMY